LFAGLEVMMQWSGWASATESQTARRRPLPGGVAGAQLKHPATDISLALGNYDILAAIRNVAQGCQVKSGKGLFSRVIMKTAANLIISDPIDQRVIMLDDFERSLKPQTKLIP